ncbi:MAG TPA: hypothetical protein VJN89_21475 [Candidatus Acidoferrum sp.]|nr:hypothetical protein [Candidatus Acidoferrum sp.]
MPTCPICQADLQKPPEDVRDWFRCDTCGTPLQVPSDFARLLLWISIVLGAVGTWVVGIIGAGYLRRIFPGMELHVPYAFMGAIVLGVYAVLVRWLWKTRLMRPKSCDPYSALGLSDDRKKTRGR